MTPFSAPVDDILFTLEHIAGAERLPDWDSDLTAEIVTQFARFAENEVAPADEAADREGCTLTAGRVAMPEGLVQAYQAFTEQGWQALSLPEDAGGQDMPAPLAGAVTEILAGASHSFQMVIGLVPGAARTIARFGTEAQKQKWLPCLASGEWLATMALTEAGAGSDLSQIRSRAVTGAEGWRVDGEKIFISGGDQNLSPRILHLVLARSGETDSGVRGLSLFLVPSHDDAGARLPLSITRIEDKLGLNASPTCQMLFDMAPAEILGNEGEGLAAMFTMMNQARMDVSLQGVAHAARAGHIARDYAATRKQGRHDGQPANIEAHPDVARMLDDIDATAIANRALSYLTLVELALNDNPAFVDFMTPLCKFACTEGGVSAANTGIQVLGGYGYLEEYRVAQNLRDARITTIYEGTSGILANTLATRLLQHSGGAAAEAFTAFLAEAPEAAQLWENSRQMMLAAADPRPAAHDFTWLSIEAAKAVIWQKIAAKADVAADPAKLHRLAQREAKLRPIRMAYLSGLVAAALV